MASTETPRGQDRSPRSRLGADARRDAILSAAQEAFARAPYADVRVSDIAQAAQASPALVFRYFGTKADLYATLTRDSAATLARAQADAVAALPPNSSARDQVRTTLTATLDHIATHPAAWANPFERGDEPPEAVTARHAARSEQLAALRRLVRPHPTAREEFALAGYLGFVEQACVEWVRAACPPDRRDPLIDASLGALEGSLGDWAH